VTFWRGWTLSGGGSCHGSLISGGISSIKWASNVWFAFIMIVIGFWVVFTPSRSQ
jgi:hypothetical protein